MMAWVMEQEESFQSTRPMRGATQLCEFMQTDEVVSIHAPHAGRDLERRTFAAFRVQFQSTRPMRGATAI